MNLWAIQILRKSHSKEILRAKIVDVESMNVTVMSEDLLIGAMLHGGIVINNLGIKDNKVVLTGFDKTHSKNNTKMYMHRESNNGKLLESFVIVLKGYKAVYEFIADNPYKEDSAIHLIGTVRDLDALLDIAEINWDSYGLYNGYITNKTWAYEKDSGRYKIMCYTEKLVNGKLVGEHEDLHNPEIAKIADLRLAIDCEYCQMKLINGLPVISNIKFASDEVTIPEGIYYFSKSFGGAYMITFPKSLVKLGNKCFDFDEDILQVNFTGSIQSIPARFAAESNIQVFNYPEELDLETIEEFAFDGCMDLRSDLICKVQYIKKCAFKDTSIQKVIIPNCKEIGAGAFKDCLKLQTVKLGDSVIIKDYAFCGCSKLSHIDLRGATYIGKNAFKGCKKLKDVLVRKGTHIAEDAFHKNTNIHYI